MPIDPTIYLAAQLGFCSSTLAKILFLNSGFRSICHAGSDFLDSERVGLSSSRVFLLRLEAQDTGIRSALPLQAAGFSSWLSLVLNSSADFHVGSVPAMHEISTNVIKSTLPQGDLCTWHKSTMRSQATCPCARGGHSRPLPSAQEKGNALAHRFLDFLSIAMDNACTICGRSSVALNKALFVQALLFSFCRCGGGQSFSHFLHGYGGTALSEQWSIQVGKLRSDLFEKEQPFLLLRLRS